MGRPAVKKRNRPAKAALPKPRRQPSPNRLVRSDRPPVETSNERDIRRLNRLTEQLVTAVTELQGQMAEMEARFCYKGRLSDELVSSGGSRR